MRLLPRSLLWRTFALIAVLLVVSQAAGIAIFGAFERGPRARQTAQQIASMVNITRAALLTADPAKRLDLLRELSASEGIRVYAPGHEEETLERPDRPMLDLITAAVREELGDDTQLRTEQGGVPGLWVSFRIDDEEYWIVMPRERVERQQPWTWLWWGALSALLSLVTAWLVVSRIARPLRDLTTAAAARARGASPAPVPESGPEELRTLAGTFNRMNAALERAGAERALLLAGVSHDLRTPLSRLRLAAEMLGEADRGIVDGMVQDVEDMDAVIEQFLDFARDPSGEPVEPRADLDALVTEVAERYARRGRPVSARPGGVPPLPLRPMAMQRLVANLVENALHYAGTPVEVVTGVDGDGPHVCVLDRGPGIPEAEAERLLQPFTRLDASRTGGTGAGLGLAIVERIARMHGGTIVLRPRAGGGLEARVSLPFPAG